MKDQQSPFKRYRNWRQAKRTAEQLRYEKMNATQKFVSWVKTIVNAVIVVTIINGLALASMFVPTPSMESTVLAGENLFVNKAIFGPSTPQIIPIVNIPLPYYKLPALKDPKQGDIIVFIFPGNREQVASDEFQYYLKRCVAVAGDSLQIKDDSVFVNGVQFHLPLKAKHDSLYRHTPEMDVNDRYNTFPRGKGFTRSNYGPIRIPKKGDVVPLTRASLLEWNTFIRREGHAVSVSGDQVLVDGAAKTSYTVERDYVFGMGDNRWNSADSRYFGFIPVQNVVGTPMVVYWSMENREMVRSVNPETGRMELHEDEMPLLKRFLHIRWSRLGTVINK